MYPVLHGTFMRRHQIQYPEGQEGLFILSPPPARRIFERVVSGGQTGADQGGLDAALALGVECGGWCPKGRLSETGPIPDRYPVQDWRTKGYPARTKANVVDSDGTLIFAYGKPTGGTGMTVKLCKELGKPVLVVDLGKPIDPEAVWRWGYDHEVFKVNVAGPRESKQPGIQAQVAAVMGRILEYAKGCYPLR